jgi:hypothetical protein
MKKLLIVAATAFALTGPALAFQCPALMAQIDAALETAELSDADRERVMELRQSGEEAHAAGNHAQSEEDLHAALEILGQ